MNDLSFTSKAEWNQYYAGVDSRLGKTPPQRRRIVRQLPPPPTPAVRPPGGIPLSSIPAFLPKPSGRKPVRSELLGAFVSAKTIFRRPEGRDWLMVDPTVQGPRVPPVPSLLWRNIVAEVARKHKVYVSDIMSLRRARPIVAARYECVWRLRKETTLSLGQIGRRLGRDHTTIMHGIAKHQARVDRGEA